MTESSSGDRVRHCVVWVEYRPSSLHGNQWTADFRSTPLLRYCIDGLRKMTRCEVLLAAPKTTSPRIKDVLASCELPLWWSGFERTLPALREIAAAHGAARLLAVHWLAGVGLMPEDLLFRFVERAEDLEGDVVIADGLPIPLYAHVYRDAALEFFREPAQQPVMPDSPPDVIGRFEAIFRDSPPDQRALRIDRVPILEHYGISRYPRFIPWEQKSGLDRIDAVLSAYPREAVARLEALRTLVIEDIEAIYRKRSRPVTVSRPIRVLYASNPSAYSGAEECLINSVRSLGSRVEAHALVAVEGVFTERLRSTGVEVHCPGHDFAIPSVKNNLLMHDLLEQVRPDLVHCNAFVGSPLLSAAIVRGLPHLQWLRVAEIGAHDEHLSSADRITVVSQFVAGILSNVMVQSDKIRVLYDGIDCDRFSPNTAAPRDVRQEYGIADDEQVILCAARFAPYKRHDVLIDAFAMLARDLPQSRLLLAGEASTAFAGTYERSMARIRAHGIESRVLVLGFQPDVISVEKAADVVVQCSEREPLGTVVLESMALAKPVIVAASGGLPEMIEDGVTGLHCAPGDPVSLRDQLWRILRNRDLAASLGDRARARAVERFALSAHRDALLAIYDELTSGGAAMGRPGNSDCREA